MPKCSMTVENLTNSITTTLSTDLLNNFIPYIIPHLIPGGTNSTLMNITTANLKCSISVELICALEDEEITEGIGFMQIGSTFTIA